MTSTARRLCTAATGAALLALALTSCGSGNDAGAGAATADESNAIPAPSGLDAAREYRSVREADPVADPVAVAIPAIDVDGPLTRTGIDDRELEVPDFGDMSWFESGTAPGDPGPAAILGHVDTRKGPDVFYRLHELEPGDSVVVDTADGESLEFVIDRVEQHDKDEFPTENVWLPGSEPRLHLITCGGEFDRSAGSYRDNVIAFATLNSS
ncbi:class F sortase [Haloechinothrix sp. YIM 98757]|uniref:Class F sortase n=1 Tax=Haloechinothrix aidingensis TaxID=2752311 RepID=A0A838AD60_9PSEU|nr:class F sortase [Haloechinothrix aidingensis]MBA0127115.1 class F sortase [Haloechinothrix aidingensis]